MNKSKTDMSKNFENPSFYMDKLEENDPVFAFDQLMKEVNIEKYLLSCMKNKTGRPRYNKVRLLKTVLFAFVETGYASLRQIEDRCKTNIRYMYLMEGKTPCYRTFGNFIKGELTDKIEEIYQAVMSYIIEQDHVDTEHIYIDGTKLEANANKYSWVWKKGTEKARYKLFVKITTLLEEINKVLPEGIAPLPTNTEYSPESIKLMLSMYTHLYKINESTFIHGKGHRKNVQQRHYEKLKEYYNKLCKYVKKLSICDNHRNSYSKKDNDATFMRIKTDYMGNDQLLPAYNVQICVADEYVVLSDVMQFRSDMDAFIPLMNHFYDVYGHYPKYPVADAGYGSFNNYLFCEQHGMEKYMKFTMYKKETKDKKYQNDPFRAVNFKISPEGDLLCPNNRCFKFAYRQTIKGNLYGRQEEIFICEDCSNCPYFKQCRKRDEASSNRRITINEELTAIHQEVIDNLGSIQGALLRMNRSIQAEGVFGIVKEDRRYRRIVRKGLKSVTLEILLVLLGFNCYKYYNKHNKMKKVA